MFGSNSSLNRPSRCPIPGSSPLPERPVVVGSGPGGLVAGVLPRRAGLSAARPGARPGRQRPHPRRQRLRRRRAVRPREQLPLRRRRRRHVQRRQADLPRHRARRPPRPGAVRRVQGQAVDPLRPPAAPGQQPPAGGRQGDSPADRGARRRGPVLAAGSRTSTSRDGQLRGVDTSSRLRSRPTSSCWPSATAPATPTRCCCAAACRWSRSRFRWASASSSRRRSSTACKYGRGTARRASSARPTTPWWPAATHDLFTFCMCAGGYVMPSVSEPGYFCTNGMSLSSRDSPFANSGLVVTVPRRAVRRRRRAGRRALASRTTNAGRSSWAAASIAVPIQSARRFPRPAGARGDCRRRSYPRGAGARRRCAELVPPLVVDGAAPRPADHGPPLARPVPGGGDAGRPRGARQLAGAHRPRRRRAARSPGIAGCTRSAKGPATPAASSAPPWTACGRRRRSWRNMRHWKPSKVVADREMVW